jgi:hypothetical protein
MKIISLIFGSVGMKRTTNLTSVIERFSLGDLYEKLYHHCGPWHYSFPLLLSSEYMIIFKIETAAKLDEYFICLTVNNAKKSI